MEDETLSAAPELETANPAADEPQTPELETDQQIEGEAPEGELPEEEQPADDDFEEFEWEGKQIRAPKGLKEGVLRQADYTRKTQDIAQKARELEERAARIEQQSQASQEEIQARAQAVHIEAELKRFEGFDWAAYQQARQTDPYGADEAWNYVQHLRAQKGEAEAKISAAAQQRTEQAQQELAKRLQQTQEHARKLPGWKPEADTEVIEFARSKGIPDEQLRSIMSPAAYEVLYLARIGESALKNKAPKPAGTAPKPLTVVGAKSSPPPRKSLAEMDMDEYVAARQAKRG